MTYPPLKGIFKRSIEELLDRRIRISIVCNPARAGFVNFKQLPEKEQDYFINKLLKSRLTMADIGTFYVQLFFASVTKSVIVCVGVSLFRNFDSLFMFFVIDASPYLLTGVNAACRRFNRPLAPSMGVGINRKCFGITVTAVALTDINL